MSIYQISNFYNFYYSTIKNINRQNYTLSYVKQSTESLILKRGERSIHYTPSRWLINNYEYYEMKNNRES
jgi:hypothetical protein